jgi:hypothetical protein
MLSARRGWLQQLLDQYNGHSLFPAARCWSSSSPFPLKINSENARCSTPLPA